MTKTKQANDMIDNRGVVYAKNETKLLWPIKPGMVYEKNKTRQQHNRSYKWSLHQKQN